MARDGTPTGAPTTLELLWGTAERPSRGPKPRLSVDKVVQAAIGVADAEGLDAVSMQRVAQELGYTTMSLYRYVSSKEQLVELMVDTAIGSAPEVEGVPGGWRAGIHILAREMVAVFRRHPWLLRHKLEGPPQGPCSLSWLEQGLRAFSTSGLGSAEMVQAFMFLDGAVRELARVLGDVEQAQRRAGLTADQAERDYGRFLRGIPADRYPALAAVAADGAFEAADPADRPEVEVEIEFGIERLLDGIEAYVAAQRAARE